MPGYARPIVPIWEGQTAPVSTDFVILPSQHETGTLSAYIEAALKLFIRTDAYFGYAFANTPAWFFSRQESYILAQTEKSLRPEVHDEVICS